MADWIKVEHCLADKPEILIMAAKLGMDRYAVMGRLLTVWTWFDCHTVNGNVSGVTGSFVDTLIACAGFAEAMQNVGWLAVANERVSVPNFDRHISKSAKARALTNIRVKRSRNAPSVTKALPDQNQNQIRTDTDKVRTESTDSDHRTFGVEAVREEAGAFAADLFRKIRFSGKDGKLIWQVAVAVRMLGKVSEAHAVSAATGAGLVTGVRNSVAYFRTCLRESTPGIDALIKTIRLPGKEWGPPAGVKDQDILKFADNGKSTGTGSLYEKQKTPDDLLRELENLQHRE